MTAKTNTKRVKQTKQEPAQGELAVATAAALSAPATIPAAATEMPATRQRSESSTPKRPKAGGKCAAVWAYLDEHGDMMPKALREVAVAQGWNANNAAVELYYWRKFNGITKAKEVSA